MQHDLTFASATEIARAIRTGRISASAMLEHYLSRVARHNDDVNAIVVLRADEARALARAADEAMARGDIWGPLHGVPMTVKEAFDWRGTPSTWGFSEHTERCPQEDSLAVQRLMAAGAVLFGKTNVPVALSDWQTFNPIYGTTNNPWDLSRTPGGSSGGSAAALAAGLTGLELGSDIGASIRNPAHYCGVYGHKPTFGVAASQGQNTPGFEATPETDIAVIGPMARSAFDLEVALQAIVGMDAIDSVGLSVNLPKPPGRQLKDFKVGIVYDDVEASVDAAVQDALRELSHFLREAGAIVDEDARPEIDSAEVHDTYLLQLRATTSPGSSELLLQAIANENPSADDRSYRAQMVRGIKLTHREFRLLNEQRHRMRRKWAEYFDSYDLLLCPAATTVAFAHNQRGERWERMVDVNGTHQPTTTALFWAGYSGHFYLPSTVAPIVMGDKLPVGVQIVGPQYWDYRCIQFAQLLETHYRGFEPPNQFLN